MFLGLAGAARKQCDICRSAGLYAPWRFPAALAERRAACGRCFVARGVDYTLGPDRASGAKRKIMDPGRRETEAVGADHRCWLGSPLHRGLVDEIRARLFVDGYWKRR